MVNTELNSFTFLMKIVFFQYDSESGIYRDKTMVDILMFIPNYDDTQINLFYRL